MIFVGSMCDLFGDWIPDVWIEVVFKACRDAPHHVYAFLTKNPARYTYLAKKGMLPGESNFWYGSTATTESDTFWWSDIHNTFVSIEPIMGPFHPQDSPVKKTDWVIVGAETGSRKEKVRPEPEWITAIVKNCRATETPVFLKNNIFPYIAPGIDRPYPQEVPSAIGAHKKGVRK
jgi:protein gp37